MRPGTRLLRAVGAQDAVKSGFRVKFLWDLTRPVTEANDAMVREALGKAGIAIV